MTRVWVKISVGDLEGVRIVRGPVGFFGSDDGTVTIHLEDNTEITLNHGEITITTPDPNQPLMA